ncbi:MAG: dihydroorotate dehydrogenase [Candidatus Poseidoniaceae archaeon]|jgi:dihydroorotate dehydrogenase|tara:strand:- start:471 stop:1601 length:1131 start_codon:yes stop_codon:yes gene_type:complete
MGIGYRVFVRPTLRVQDSEKAHGRALLILRAFSSNPLTRGVLSLLYRPRKNIPIHCFGQTYQHPFGNAAGLDKRAEALRGWEAIGVSFIEIGGVTEHEQDGNPKPRMFRATPSRSLVNRMGFNNPGSQKVAQQLQQHFAKFGSPSVPLWANLGKSKITSLEDAPNDYAQTMDRLWDFCDVFVINVSSPNTPNLRELQHDTALESIIDSCTLVNQKNAESTQSKIKPLLVKISPDLSDEQLVAIVKTARDAGCDGIIATNTTTERPVSSSTTEEQIFAQTGGLSGSPLANRSTDIVHQIYSLTNGEWPIIGVGGILSAEDAWAKIGAGACLLQAYSGFVFEGAGLTKSIVHGLDKKLKEHGYSTLQEAVGFSHRITA